ncbi:MAG TPA: VOC family protein [Streptosporangiaceae bacterium]
MPARRGPAIIRSRVPWPELYDQGSVLETVRLQEGKAVKNRLHLDLRPKDQAAEVARLEALGARRVDVGQGADTTWVVLADPEGNEFDVLRGLRPEELAAQQAG